MKDKLIIEEDRYRFRIVWFLADEGEQGAFLGERDYTQDDPDRASDEDRPHIAATLAVKSLKPDRDIGGFWWETQREAKHALIAANAAIKGAPWPDWAVKAKAAGWSPPKGWTP